MLVLHISAESVKRLQHICILDALEEPRTRTKMLLIGGGSRNRNLTCSMSLLFLYSWLAGYHEENLNLMPECSSSTRTLSFVDNEL